MVWCDVVWYCGVCSAVRELHNLDAAADLYSPEPPTYLTCCRRRCCCCRKHVLSQT